MKVHIVNQCQNIYTPDPEETIRQILNKIPETYVSGLDAIHLVDARRQGAPSIEYIHGHQPSRQSRIEVSMDDSAFSGTPFFSRFSLNVDVLLCINDHIEQHVKKHTHDQSILRKDTTRVCYDWMYLGAWQPLLILFRAGHVLLSQSQIFQKIVFYFFTRFIRKVKKNLEQLESTQRTPHEDMKTNDTKSS